MAAVFTKKSDADIGKDQLISGDLALDNSYPGGGYPISIRDLPFRVRSKIHSLNTTGSGGYVAEWVPDPANPRQGNLFIAESGGGAGPLVEVAGGTDLSGIVLSLQIHGR